MPRTAMPLNIEIKFCCDDLDALESRCRATGATPRGTLVQRDTFFAVPQGRLKLREVGPDHAELIAYSRPDAAEARASDYAIAPVADVAATLAVLSRSLGVTATLAKRRRLWTWRGVRIHLDAVAGLGTFVEFESVCDDRTDEAAARRDLDDLLALLGLTEAKPISVAYVDLLAR